MKFSFFSLDNNSLSLSLILKDNNHECLIYDKLYKTNKSKGIRITKDLSECVLFGEYFIFTSNINDFKNILNEISLIDKNKAYYISYVKDIDSKTLKTPITIIKETIELEFINGIIVIYGNLYLKEIIEKRKTTLSITSLNLSYITLVKKYFENDYVSIDNSFDINGALLIGPLFNIMSLGYGLISNKEISISQRGSYIALCFEEIKKIVNHFRGDTNTVYQSVSYGSFIASLTTNENINYQLGKQFLKNMDDKEFIKSNIIKIESYESIKAISEISNKYNLGIKVFLSLYDIVCKDITKINQLIKLIS